MAREPCTSGALLVPWAAQPAPTLRRREREGPAGRAGLQSTTRLSNAGRRHETFPRDCSLHKHPGEALQGVHKLREPLAQSRSQGRHHQGVRVKGIPEGLLRAQARRAAHQAGTRGSGAPRPGTNSPPCPSSAPPAKAKRGYALSPGAGPCWTPGLVQRQRPSGPPQRQEINQLSLFLN